MKKTTTLSYIISGILFFFGLLHSSNIFAFGSIDTYIPGLRRILGPSGSMGNNTENSIEKPFVIVPQRTRQVFADKELAHHVIRLSIIKQLLHSNTATFISNPYVQWQSNFGLTVKDNKIAGTTIDTKDDLDLIIDNQLQRIGTGNQDLSFTKQDIEALQPIYLRKSAQDLQDLGYEVVSSRYRTNTDPSYRRHNIITAFKFLGHIKVLNPGDSFAYLASVHYDPKQKKNYKNGLAIVNDDEIPVYGGGLCGGSTAIYQGLLTNKGLQLKGRNHSKWFSNLYTATINGKKISTPGLDATIFAGSTDLSITNISDHPIILAFNYNGNYGGVEEILSLGTWDDKGDIEFVGKSVKSKTVSKKNPKTGSGYLETVRTGCYTRKINGKNKVSCYKEIH